MKISIFGLGYVGTVSAMCLADMGHQIIGVDPDMSKIDLLNAAQSPIIEAGLNELIVKHVGCSNFKATQNHNAAILNTDLSFICVGTPSKDNGDLESKYIELVCTDIGKVLAEKNEFHVVVVRSTILPGTIRNIIIPLLEKHSSKKTGIDFGVCNNPEFLREGTAIHDFWNPPKTVIGETDKRSGDMVEALYTSLPAPLIRCPIEVGEMVKYADNAWHATKIVFANEIGKLCKAMNIDSHKVMDIFCQDTKLNLSPYYLKPGFAFGGSCLPKDVRALNYQANNLHIKTPLLDSLLPSNQQQIKLALEMIQSTKKKSIGVLGLSFKAGTDDLRESPIVKLVSGLLEHNFKVNIYDPNISIEKLIGANRDYIFNTLPNIEEMLSPDMQSVIAQSEVILLANNSPEFTKIETLLRPEQIIIDLVRMKNVEIHSRNYMGICW